VQNSTALTTATPLGNVAVCVDHTKKLLAGASVRNTMMVTSYDSWY